MTQATINFADIHDVDKFYTYEYNQSDTILDLKKAIAEEEGFVDPNDIKLFLQCLELDDQCNVNAIANKDELYILFPKYATFECKGEDETFVFWKRSGKQRWLKLMPGKGSDQIQIPRNKRFAVMRNK